MGECISVLLLVGQKKTALVRRNRQQLPKISGFLIFKANIMRGGLRFGQEDKDSVTQDTKGGRGWSWADNVISYIHRV